MGEGDSENNVEAFRWTKSEGMVGLGNLGGLWSSAWDVSADGTVVVGESKTSSGNNRAFRWTLEEGMVGLGNPTSETAATAVSADGSIIVGNIGKSSGFRWTESSGMEIFTYGANVMEISADGSVIVGMKRASSGYSEAFQWTEDKGIQFLGDLPGGGPFSRAEATSADGSVIVGWASTQPIGSPVAYYDAFIWDADHGMRNLTDVLRNEYGLDLPIQILGAAKAISDDGLIIAGNLGPIGWVATIPEPATAVLLGIGSLVLRKRSR